MSCTLAIRHESHVWQFGRFTGFWFVDTSQHQVIVKIPQNQQKILTENICRMHFKVK